jgi:transposase
LTLDTPNANQRIRDFALAVASTFRHFRGAKDGRVYRHLLGDAGTSDCGDRKASRREAAEEFAVSASTAVIWVKCFRQTGRCAAKPRDGSISPLEKHADFLLGLIEKQPDLTLDEVVLDAQGQDCWQPHRGLALL